MNLEKIIMNGDRLELRDILPDMKGWSTCAVGQKLNLPKAKNDSTNETLAGILHEHDRKLYNLGNQVYFAMRDFVDSSSAHDRHKMVSLFQEIKKHEPAPELLGHLNEYYKDE